MSDVVFALRRNASTDPPEHGRLVWTDQGAARAQALGSLVLYTTSAGGRLDAQPEWWLDVRPSDEPLTTDDLRWLIEQHESREWTTVKESEIVARLRAALDALRGTS